MFIYIGKRFNCICKRVQLILSLLYQAQLFTKFSTKNHKSSMKMQIEANIIQLNFDSKVSKFTDPVDSVTG